MRGKTIAIKILAILGTVMVWFPVILPLVGLAQALIRPPDPLTKGNFDYLLPAELFPLALLGMILLVAAELLAAGKRRLHRHLIFWGFGGTFVLLVSGRLVAMLSGLASGDTPVTSLWWTVVLAALGGYVLALVAVGIGGLLLVGDLFFPSHPVGAAKQVSP
jgi:hypothetical protein